MTRGFNRDHGTAGARVSVNVGWLVRSPDVSQRVTDLTHGGAGAQGLTQRVEQVLRGARRPPEVIDPARELRGVPAVPQRGQPLRLIPLDPAIAAPRLVPPPLGDPEPAD